MCKVIRGLLREALGDSSKTRQWTRPNVNLHGLLLHDVPGSTVQFITCSQIVALRQGLTDSFYKVAKTDKFII